MKKPTLLLSLIVLLSTVATHAEVPHLVRYQGYITDKNSPPQGLNGKYEMIFTLYDAENDGNIIWQEIYNYDDESQIDNRIDISGGQFSVLLGSVMPLDNIKWEDPLWLEIQVEGEIMDARQRITSVPFALKAETIAGDSLYVDSETGNVGIGTTSPEATLHVTGNLDADTKLLLHFNEDFNDETGKTITANGNAQIDTAQSVFGGASGLFDGTGDYLTIPDHDDWNFGTGDFTIDFWVRFSDTSGYQYFCSQVGAGNYSWFCRKEGDNKLEMIFYDTNGMTYTGRVHTAEGFSFVTDRWYHLAFVRSGATAFIFVDGISQSASVTSFGTLEDYDNTSDLFIGADGADANSEVKGWLDEFRISKGIARWVSDFTPPASEYTYAGGNAIFTGDVKAKSFIGNIVDTGDITFNKDGQTLWRMFEEEDGLYLESTKTGKSYKMLMEEASQ